LHSFSTQIQIAHLQGDYSEVPQTPALLKRTAECVKTELGEK